jgi:hypothetical protein
MPVGWNECTLGGGLNEEEEQNVVDARRDRWMCITDIGSLAGTLNYPARNNRALSCPCSTKSIVRRMQALVDLENSVPDLKMELRPLQISAAREVDVRGGKKAIVVFVPVPQLKAFHKVQARYVLSWSCRPTGHR